MMAEYIDPPSSLKPGSVVWAYLRDSGGDAQEQSVPQQRAEIEAYCKRHGLVLGNAYGSLFIDEAKSGGSASKRDAFQEMLNLCSDSYIKPNGILVWSCSRFGRNVEDTQDARRQLKRKKIVFHSLNDAMPEDGSDRTLYEGLIDWKNEKFLEELSRDVKRSLAALVQRGYSAGGFPPRGYKAEKVIVGYRRDGTKREGSRWVPDPDLWELVKLAWVMRAEGKTYKEIQEATCRKIYKSDNCWVSFFKNKTYLGIGKCGELEIEDHHPAAVDLETWNRVQEIQKASPRFGAANHPNHPRRVGYPSLLSGLAVCIHCGSSIGIHTHRNWSSYVCRKKENQDYRSCEGRLINARKADRVILESLFNQVLTVDFMGELYEQTKGLINSQDDLEAEIGHLRTLQAENEKRVRNLLDTAEAFGPEAVRDRLPGKLAERGRLAAELQALESKKQALKSLDISPEAFALVVETWRSEALGAREEVTKIKELMKRFISRLELGYNIAKVFYTFPIDGFLWPYHPLEKCQVGGTWLKGCKVEILEWS